MYIGYLTYKLGRFLTHKCDLEQRLQLEVIDFFLMGLVSREGGLDMRDLLLLFSSSSPFLSLLLLLPPSRELE